MSNSNDFVQVNNPTTLGKKLATYKYTDGGGNEVESEAVTLTDSAGNEVEPATQGTLAAAAATLLSIDSKIKPASTSTEVTAFPASIVAATILAASATRLGWSIFNNSSTESLYILVGGVGPVTPTNFTAIIPPQSFYEDRYHFIGEVDGVWTSGAGNAALVTDYQP